MRKTYLTVIITLMLLLSQPALSYDSTNILTNPGFESGTYGWLDRYCSISAVTSPVPHGGTYCARAYDRTATWQGIQQDVIDKMVVGETYTVSGWVRTSTSANSNIQITFQQTDDDGTNYHGAANGTASNSSWVQIHGNFTLNVTGTLTQLLVYVEGPDSGIDIYVDDVVVYGPAVADINNPNVEIDLTTTHQTIRGFGGISFNRWSHGLQNDTQVDTAFGNGPDQLGFTILRIDVSPYSSDWGFEVDAAQRAIDNHGAIVFASPWSPPAYMKRYADPCNGLIGGELDPNFYDDYADHLSDFVDYMSNNGVSLYAISLQNEPDVSVGYESCDWTSTQMRNFLKNNASVIPTRVMVAESYNFNHSFTNPILNDPCAEAQADIIGGHIYGGGLYDYPLARNKGKEVWMTEHFTESAHDADEWPLALDVGKEIHDCMVVNMNSYIWWYIRRYYGPMGESGNITKRGYCMSHFAKFARPGYSRVSATANPSLGVYVTAYRSDDTLVIVAVNQNSSSKEVKFSLFGGGVCSYTKYETSSSSSLSDMGSVGSTDTLAGYSINTFVGTIIPGDLNNDCGVDLIDFAILGKGWLDIYDYYTLADIADNWLYGI